MAQNLIDLVRGISLILYPGLVSRNWLLQRRLLSHSPARVLVRSHRCTPQLLATKPSMGHYRNSFLGNSGIKLLPSRMVRSRSGLRF